MSESAQEAGAFSSGTVLGGSTVDNRGWIKAAMELQRDTILARANVSSNINVEVVFHIPGNILAPDYEGLRTGTYWRSKSLLQIQVALPSVAPVDPRSALIQLLWDALDLVESWAATKGKSVDTTALRGIVAEVAGRAEEFDKIALWFESLGFHIRLHTETSGLVWADLLGYPAGNLVAPKYGRGSSEIGAARRARQRYLEEQLGDPDGISTHRSWH